MFNRHSLNRTYTAILPILATASIKQYFAGHFVGMMDTPGVSYVSNSDLNGHTFDQMTVAISRTWPLLAISLLMSLNAGFVIWILVSLAPEVYLGYSFTMSAKGASLVRP